MTALAIFGLGVPELLIILALVLLLFGGARLAGLGKSTGRAIKEFKEETKGLKQEGSKPTADDPMDTYDEPPAVTSGPAAPTPDYRQPPQETTSGASDPEPRRDV